jgi:signal transduction histidine kinase/integral membrane sensor domain MASE1
MLDNVPPAARGVLLRITQITITFVLFALCNALAIQFEVESGVSILFPATAVGILACMYFGPWAAVGIILGTMATPWTSVSSVALLFGSGVISAIEGLIPWTVFHLRRDLDRDLRDVKSLFVFLLCGTILNTGFSAVAGNILVVPHPHGATFEVHQILVWWLADFTAALLLATPILAFGGTVRRRLIGDLTDGPQRSLINALQIVVVLILLGWGAAFAIRNYLLHALEDERFHQQRVLAEAEETINAMHSNFLRAAFIDPNEHLALAALDVARQRNDNYIKQLAPLVAAASPELRTRFPIVARQTDRWFDFARGSLAGKPTVTEGGAHATGRSILELRGAMERANIAAWSDFASKRRRIMLVGSMVDGLVLLILVLTSGTLLVNVSRPFRQFRDAIAEMRAGGRFDASRITSQYVEFRALAATLEETSRELQHREEALRLQTERAVAASRHKSEFLAKMSHELRTPLNSIIGFSDLLTEQEETITSHKRMRFLRNVSSSAQHLLDLINDLLDISKADSGKLPMLLEEIDIRTAIQRSVAASAQMFERKQQRLDVQLPPDPVLVRADSHRFEQALLNLLSNANKFSPEGEPVEITTACEASHVHIRVRDRGIGIRKEDQGRIFNDFEQIQATGTLSSGTGLGLALAKRFVEAHGGQIAVESEPGAGAVFSVTLPRV